MTVGGMGFVPERLLMMMMMSNFREILNLGGPAAVRVPLLRAAGRHGLEMGLASRGAPLRPRCPAPAARGGDRAHPQRLLGPGDLPPLQAAGGGGALVRGPGGQPHEQPGVALHGRAVVQLWLPSHVPQLQAGRRNPGLMLDLEVRVWISKCGFRVFGFLDPGSTLELV